MSVEQIDKIDVISNAPNGKVELSSDLYTSYRAF